MVGFLAGQPAFVIGAGGGIGTALAVALEQHGAIVTRYSRSAANPEHRLDLRDEASIAAAAANAPPEPRLVLVATGILHAPALLNAPGLAPEKTYRALSADALLTAWQINAIGPALIAKHFLPLLPRHGKAVFAALAARVGSIGDNRSGGWHAYRASKAGLAMILKNLAIEQANQRPDQIILGLHPGTVETALSAPFRRAVPKLFSPQTAASNLLAVIDAATPLQSGQVLAWDGSVVPP